MDFAKQQYIEINLIGVVLLLAMLGSMVGIYRSSKEESQKVFKGLLVCNAMILLADTAVYLLRWHTAPVLMALSHASCVLYFFMHPLFGYFWLSYCVRALYPTFKPTLRQKNAALLPLALAGLLTIASPWTGWVYWLTEQNRYQRGTLLWVVMALSCLYWLFSAILAFLEWLYPGRIRERSTYYTLLFFPIPTILGNFVQLKFYGLPVVWICSAVSLLLLFISLQNDQLSCDHLTGLFNRGQTNKQLAWEISRLKNTEDLLFVIMVDVDHFKGINDQFGHLIGDQALKEVAEILRESCRSKDFVGRFGGDEFIVLGHARRKKEVEELIAEIEQSVARHRRRAERPYALSLSTGYSVYRYRDGPTVDRIISAADQAMYDVKACRNKKTAELRGRENGCTTS